MSIFALLGGGFVFLVALLPIGGDDAREESLALLRPGNVVSGSIGKDNASVATETLRAYYSGFVVHGQSFRVEVPKTGPYCFELRSYFFDCYLVLRDADGTVLAEDDDGLINMHSRLTMPCLVAGRAYRLEACALRAKTGNFELRYREGLPDALSPTAKRRADLADARERVRSLELALGPAHPDTAQAWNDLGALLLDQGDYRGARAPYERALTIREEALVDLHVDTATSLHNLAFLMMTLGEYESAESFYERASAMYAATVGPDHRDSATCLHNLAYLLVLQGEFERARPLIEQALATRERLFGPVDTDVATSLHDLGIVLHAQGDFDGAYESWQRVLSIYETALGEDHPFVANTLGRLANVAIDRGEYAAARPLAERALVIREKTLGREHSETANGLNTLARILVELGDYAAARALYERAISIDEVNLGPDHIALATYLDNLGLALVKQGNYSAARPALERALDIRTAILGPEHPRTSWSLNNVALFLKATGDHQAARPFFERALAIDEARAPEHPGTATTLNNLGAVLEELGNPAEARECYERALSIFEKAQGRDHPNVALSLSFLGHLVAADGNNSAAATYLRRALSIREAAHGPDHPATASAVRQMAMVLAAQGRYRDARDYFRRTLSIRERVLGPNHPNTARSLDDLALFSLDRGVLDEALAFSMRAIEGQETHRRQHGWSFTEAERLLFARTQRRTFRVLLSVALHAGSDASARSKAYDTLLGWKADVFRGLSRARGRTLAALSQDDRERVERIRQVQARLSREVYRTDVVDGGVHADLLVGLRKERVRLEQALHRSLGPVETAEVVPNANQLAQALPGDSAFLDFFVHSRYVGAARGGDGSVVSAGFWGRPRLSVWALRSGSNVARHVDLGEADVIEQSVRGYLTELLGSSVGVAPLEQRGVRVVAASRKPDAGRRLRSLLWEPLAPLLKGVSRVFVSPDGFVGGLPFEVLPDGDRGFLIERFSFVYTQDATSIAPLSRPASMSGVPTLVCVGGIDYAAKREIAGRKRSVLRDIAAGSVLRTRWRTGWQQLPHTAIEAATVFRLHERAFAEAPRLLIGGAEATEERLKSELPKHRILHLATHGFFQPEGLPTAWLGSSALAGTDSVGTDVESSRVTSRYPGYLSGLVLAGANDVPVAEREDGMLTAEEIAFLDLSEVELVVLSACETGLGRPESGEGMLGLRRAFRQAETKTVISSLWRVPDQSTSELMELFYRRLWLEGRGKHESLRGAQLEMLARNRKAHSGAGLPSTWGAFILDGAWR